jgi:putative ABC transport system permease protein
VEEVLRNAWLYRGRFLLSSVGIVVAISMVLGMRTLIHGLETFIDGQFERFGTHRAYVSRVPWGGDLSLASYRVRPRITPRVAQVVETADFVEAAAYYYRAPAAVEAGPTRLEGLDVVGTVPAYLAVEGYTVAEGRFLLSSDDELRHRVVVLGRQVADKLETVVGSRVLIHGAPFEVVGVLEPRGSLLGDSLDDSVYVPARTFEAELGAKYSLEVAAAVRPEVPMEEALGELRARVRRVRGLAADAEDDFAVNSSARLFAEYRRIAGRANAVIYAVGLLVLTVSGIGISNVMLATIRERSYEIGVKKSVGASRGAIFFETLLEVLLMCGASGVAGTAIGLALGILFRLISPVAASATPVDLTLALAFPVLTALLFGSLPAARATRIPPIGLMEV